MNMKDCQKCSGTGFGSFLECAKCDGIGKVYEDQKEDNVLQRKNEILLTALNEIAWSRHPSNQPSALVERIEKIALTAISKAENLKS